MQGGTEDPPLEPPSRGGPSPHPARGASATIGDGNDAGAGDGGGVNGMGDGKAERENRRCDVSCCGGFGLLLSTTRSTCTVRLSLSEACVRVREALLSPCAARAARMSTVALNKAQRNPLCRCCLSAQRRASTATSKAWLSTVMPAARVAQRLSTIAAKRAAPVVSPVYRAALRASTAAVAAAAPYVQAEAKAIASKPRVLYLIVAAVLSVLTVSGSATLGQLNAERFGLPFAPASVLPMLDVREVSPLGNPQLATLQALASAGAAELLRAADAEAKLIAEGTAAALANASSAAAKATAQKLAETREALAKARAELEVSQQLLAEQLGNVTREAARRIAASQTEAGKRVAELRGDMAAAVEQASRAVGGNGTRRQQQQEKGAHHRICVVADIIWSAAVMALAFIS